MMDGLSKLELSLQHMIKNNLYHYHSNDWPFSFVLAGRYKNNNAQIILILYKPIGNPIS